MSFDAAQFLRNTIRLDRADLMMPQIDEQLAPQQPVETGRLEGLPVTLVSDPAAELMDSMEELSMQFEEKAAKKLGDRKLGETRRMSTTYLNAIETWMKTLPDLPDQAATERLLLRLRHAFQEGNPPTLESLREALAELSEDPSHQFAILDIFEQALGPEEEGLISLLGTARAALMEAHGEEIRAGINLATEINARATTPEEMSALRTLYRNEILGFSTPQECFRSVLATRGAGALASAIDFLRSGCGADLASMEPSRDPVALRRILLDLQCVQVLQTVLETMDALGKRMGSEFGITMLRDSESMTGTLIDYTERSGVRPQDLDAFEASCGVVALLARMDFARELLGVFRKLSPRLFELEDDRLRLIETAEEHLDGIIAEETEASDEDEEDRV